MRNGRRDPVLAGNPVLIGALTVLVTVVAVYLAYNATNGLPFVPTYKLHVQAANASEAIEALKANSPSVITLDLIMNPVGGITSMAVVRAAALQPQNPTVFILTNKASYADREAALAAGAKQVFLKPVLAVSGFEPLFSEINKLHHASDAVATED